MLYLCDRHPEARSKRREDPVLLIELKIDSLEIKKIIILKKNLELSLSSESVTTARIH